MAVESISEKFCPACSTSKPTSAFYRSRSKPDGLQNRCKECQYQRQREHSARYCKTYRDRHKERVREVARAKRKSSAGDNRREYERQYYRKNVESRRARAHARYQSDTARMRDYRNQWSKEHYEMHKAHKCNRYAVEFGSVGRVTGQQITDKFAYNGWHCYLCVRPFPFSKLVPEHRKPLSRGGSNWIANIAPACGPCNNSKANKTESEYRLYLKKQKPLISRIKGIQ